MIIWKSDIYHNYNVDSIAVINNNVLVTSKEKNLILILDDKSGKLIDTWKGFNRPNGILAFDKYVLIIERDNKRVQLFEYSTRKLLDTWGHGFLKKPYGGTVKKLYNGYQILVTDDMTKSIYSIIYKFKNGVLSRDSSSVWKRLSFATKLESLYYDCNKDLLLVADEAREIVLIYDFKSKSMIDSFGERILTGEPEGISKWKDYYIITNQSKTDNKFYIVNEDFDIFHILKIKGVSNTDGITVNNNFLYVINDDLQVVKFNLINL